MDTLPDVNKLLKRYYTRRQMQNYCQQFGLKANTRNDQMVQDLVNYVTQLKEREESAQIQEQLVKSINEEKSQFETPTTSETQAFASEPAPVYSTPLVKQDSRGSILALNNEKLVIQAPLTNKSIEIENTLKNGSSERDSFSTSSGRHASSEFKNMVFYNNKDSISHEYRPISEEVVTYVQNDSQHSRSSPNSHQLQELQKVDTRAEQLNKLIEIVNEHRRMLKMQLRRETNYQISSFQRLSNAMLITLPDEERRNSIYK